MSKITISAIGPNPTVAPGLPFSFELDGDALRNLTVREVKSILAGEYPKFSTDRQKMTLKGDKKPLSDATRLADIGFANGGELEVKDLGAQVSWQTVFLVEYAGPLVIHPLIYHFPKVFYGKDVHHSTLQTYVYYFVLAHFAKREFETLFIHRFSHDTMPLRNIFKNSAHYHILSGLFLALDMYRPAFAATSPYIRSTYRDDPFFLQLLVGAFAFFELSNFWTHLTLRSLRPTGSRKRAIPRGYGFSLVSFPNYFFESMVWLTISLFTGSWAAYLFFTVSTGQMLLWAQKKHAAYKKEFGNEYPRGRKAMIPFIF
jgi:very-long-chain enoyl-CoA reductase